jgi:hypothetical protein
MRTWPAAVLLCVTLGLACSKDSTSPANPIDGGWTGSTSQGRPAHFLVADGHVVIAVFSFEVAGNQCTDDVLLVLGRDPGQAPYMVTNNQFVASTSGSAGTATFGGTISGTQASGALSVNAVVCQGTGNFSWSAQKATGPEINIAGNWAGDISSSQVSNEPFQMTLSQAGANLSGTWAVQTGATGTISGTVTGRMVRAFRLNETTPGCSGTFNAYATQVPTFDDVVFFYNGQDCLGAHSQGFGVTSRVPLSAAARAPLSGPTRLVIGDGW